MKTRFTSGNNSGQASVEYILIVCAGFLSFIVFCFASDENLFSLLAESLRRQSFIFTYLLKYPL